MYTCVCSKVVKRLSPRVKNDEVKTKQRLPLYFENRVVLGAVGFKPTALCSLGPIRNLQGLTTYECKYENFLNFYV